MRRPPRVVPFPHLPFDSRASPGPGARRAGSGSSAGSGATCDARRIIREERSQLRALLIQAARDGTLAYANGSLLEDFLEGTNTAATPAELEELNEEDE